LSFAIQVLLEAVGEQTDEVLVCFLAASSIIQVLLELDERGKV
jgi:hypothetical protein